MIRLLKSKASICRALTACDAENCASVHAASFHAGWSNSEFENLLTSANVIADGLFSNSSEVLMGFALSRIAADEAELLTIAIDQQYRRSGLGKLLLSEHLANLRYGLAKAVFLEVAEHNDPASKLYVNLGFKIVGQRIGYYHDGAGEAANALVMRLDL
jgi:ribosomal-protein-alanine N-acetyltransferase